MNLLTVQQVATKLSCAPSFVWALNKNDPTFPKPIQIGLGASRARATRWFEEAVNNWLLTKQQPMEKDDDHRGTGSQVHPATAEESRA